MLNPDPGTLNPFFGCILPGGADNGCETANRRGCVMPESFNPYRVWLSIPAESRPPTHYQLLGISPDEHDPTVINAAVMRQGRSSTLRFALRCRFL